MWKTLQKFIGFIFLLLLLFKVTYRAQCSLLSLNQTWRCSIAAEGNQGIPCSSIRSCSPLGHSGETQPCWRHMFLCLRNPFVLQVGERAAARNLPNHALLGSLLSRASNPKSGVQLGLQQMEKIAPFLPTDWPSLRAVLF